MRVLAEIEIQLGRESSRPEFLEAPDSKSLGALYWRQAGLLSPWALEWLQGCFGYADKQHHQTCQTVKYHSEKAGGIPSLQPFYLMRVHLTFKSIARNLNNRNIQCFNAMQSFAKQSTQSSKCFLPHLISSSFLEAIDCLILSSVSDVSVKRHMVDSWSSQSNLIGPIARAWDCKSA